MLLRFGAVALATLLAHAPPVSAQDQVSMDDGGHRCVLRAAPTLPDLDPSALRRSAPHTVTRVGGGATFEVTYTDFTAEAEAAFQRAVDIWSEHIESDVTIRVNARFAPLATGVLGSAGPRNAFANRAQFPLPSTFYPEALADALVGSDLAPGQPDLNATFSSSFPNFYFGLDGDPPSNRFDFATVVLHELGHGLGFVGSARADDGSGTPECNGTAGDGCWGLGSAPFPLAFDRFVDDNVGVAMLDETVYPNVSPELGALLISDELFFDGVTVTTLYDNMPQPVYGPTPFNAGSSYSHWDEDAFPPTTSEALMTPFVSPGEAHGDPGRNTCALFADQGWPLGPGCTALVVAADDAELAQAAALRVTGENPGRGAAELSLVLDAPGAVRVEVMDLLGRRLAVLHDAQAPAGVLVLATPAGLAPGTYLVRAVTPAGASTAQVVRL